MADWYSLPTSNDSSGIYEIFNFVNDSASGLFFPIMLLVVWVISFLSQLASGSFDRPSAGKGFVFASFVTLILAIPLTVLGLLSQTWMYGIIIVLAISVAILILERRES